MPDRPLAKDFKQSLYEGILFAFGITLSKYNVFAQGTILKAVGRQLVRYLADSGYDPADVAVEDEIGRVLALFRDNGFFESFDLEPSEKGLRLVLHKLYGIEAYYELQKRTENPFLACPFATFVYYVASTNGQRFTLYDHSLDLETGTASLEIGFEEAADDATEGLDSLVIENARLYEIAEEHAAQLESMNTEKSKLLGVVAHDLRNPMTAIFGQAELLRALLDDEHTDDRGFRELARESVPAVLDSARHVVGMIDTLLSREAIEAGSIAVRKAPCDLREVAREAVFLSSAHAEAKRIALDLSAPHPVVVSADERRMVEVLDNLVSNAVKFSPADRRVAIEVSGDGARARIAVRDEGPGLTQEDRGKLFERFQRLSARPTAGETSTGLGLSIAHDLVTRLGGRIWAESGPEQGATFFVELPVGGH